MATKTVKITVPMNRVEGDLEIRAEMREGQVVDAWSVGTMFRGFEGIMVGRGPLDGLVITPRICGICTTGHLTAAARALDMIAGVTPPPDAVRLRNLCQMAEHVQSDLRHHLLMYCVDLVNPAHAGAELFHEAVRRYTPFKGTSFVAAIRETKRMLELIAIIGGQWPHSSHMVPGGIASRPGDSDLMQCLMIVQAHRRWYEEHILGCSIESLLEVESVEQLEQWLEVPAHRDGELGFFLRHARDLGLDKLGRAYDNFLSYGQLDMPPGTTLRAPGGGEMLVPAGFARGCTVEAFDQADIAEHVAHSWFEDYGGGLHPSRGETHPYATGEEGGKYSWAKAPRYQGASAETGPLAEMVMAGRPLFLDLLARGGANALTRQLARVMRSAYLLPAMETWIDETRGNGDVYNSPGKIEEGEGFGLTHASRGALGHWVRIEGGKIQHYQVITPTAWHASPRDSVGLRGPIEEALVGVEVRDMDNPVELGHVVRSFDCCLVCTVHALDGGRLAGRVRVG